MVHLPECVSYLGLPACHFGPSWRYWSVPGRVERHGKVWRELADVHETICKREDTVAIARWLAEATASTRDREEYRQVRGLIRLLARLGRDGVKPFDHPIIRLPHIEGTLRRRPAGSPAPERLPTRLRYILGKASRLGVGLDWESFSRVVDDVDEDQFNELAATAHRMRRQGDDRRLRCWLASRTGKDDQSDSEVLLARSLLHLLDALEIF